MKEKTHSWCDGQSVREVIKEHRKLLVRIDMIMPGRGYTEAEIAAAEKRIGTMPPDVKEMYRAARPAQVDEDHLPQLQLGALDDPEVRWYRLLQERPPPMDIIFWKDQPVAKKAQQEWGKADGLLIGGTPFFDRLFWVKGHPRFADGCMLLTNHESPDPMPIVARSLAEYLRRLCFFKGVELVSTPGDRGQFELADVLRFAREFAELNPGEEEWSEWAARAVLRRDYPEGHPGGYHHWDSRQNQLVPITRAGDVQDITLAQGSQRELDSIATAGHCRRLMVVGGTIKGIEVLSDLKTLKELYIYDIAEVDAAGLAHSARLADICFLRCRVRGLAALAALKSLRRLRLEECQFDRKDLAEFRRVRPDVRLE